MFPLCSQSEEPLALREWGMPLVMVFLSHNSPTLWNWVTWVALIILKVSTFKEKEACQYSGGKKNVSCPRSPPHKDQESLSWFWKVSGKKSPACLSATVFALASVCLAFQFTSGSMRANIYWAPLVSIKPCKYGSVSQPGEIGVKNRLLFC